MRRRWLIFAIILIIAAVVGACAKRAIDVPSPVPTPTPTAATVPTQMATPVPTLSPPTAIPTPLTAEIPQETILIQSHSWHIDRSGYLHVVGEIKNQTRTNTAKHKITADLVGLDGVLVSSMSAFAYLAVLRPGQLSPFEVLFPAFSGEMSNYQLRLSWQTTEVKARTDIEIAGHSADEDAEGRYWVVGEVRNRGTEASEVVTIVGTFYDEAGTAVAAGLAVADVLPLLPGKSSSFSMLVSWPKGMSVKRYVLQTEAF